MENLQSNKKYPIYIGIIVVVLCIWLAFGADNNYSRRGGDSAVNVITITGHGEVQAVPDIANVSFTIRKEAKTVKEAQSQVALIEKSVLASLKKNNVLEKDIKTVSASFNPKYEYKYGGMCGAYNCPGRNVVVGYESYESINLKIRNTDDTGKIIEELGALGVTELSGPNFTVDNEDTLKATVRKQAIDDAKSKAKVLAKDLGIRLGKMTSFNEGGNYPTPMYAKTMMADSAVGGATAELPKGENTITSDITITYEIR